MSYHLYQVESLLKKAFELGKKELGKSRFVENKETGNYERRRMAYYPGDGDTEWYVDESEQDERFKTKRIPRIKPSSDDGHQKSLDVASTIPIQLIATWHDHPPWVEEDEYAAFFVRAMWYLHLRGISIAALHATATYDDHYYVSRWNGKLVRTSDSKGHGVFAEKRQLKVVEVALVAAGIPMWEPATKRFVDEKYGIIRSPISGLVKVAFVSTKWAPVIYPDDAVFKLEQWQTPSWNRDVKVISLVGGEVTKVLARPGDQVQKDQELLRVKNPWVKEALHLPQGHLEHRWGTQQPDGPNTEIPAN